MLSEYVALFVYLLLDPLDIEDLVRPRGHLVDHVKIDSADSLQGKLGLSRHQVLV